MHYSVQSKMKNEANQFLVQCPINLNGLHENFEVLDFSLIIVCRFVIYLFVYLLCLFICFNYLNDFLYEYDCNIC